MEEAGWIRAQWITKDTGRRARLYELTIAGKKQLGAEESRWQAAVCRRALADPFGTHFLHPHISGFGKSKVSKNSSRLLRIIPRVHSRRGEASNRWRTDDSPLRNFRRVFGDLRARSGC